MFGLISRWVSLVLKHAALSGSMIGGKHETQQMLGYGGERNSVSEIEVTPIQQINEAYESMLRQDVNAAL